MYSSERARLISTKKASQPGRDHRALRRTMSISFLRPELMEPKNTIPMTPKTMMTVP